MTKDDMKKLFLALTMLPMLVQGQTLEECQQAAEKNYPLIQQISHVFISQLSAFERHEESVFIAGLHFVRRHFERDLISPGFA